MKALITGASSGIGYAMASVLYDMGSNLILVARSEEKLEELKTKFGRKAKIIVLDLSSTYNCMELYEMCKNEKIDVVINNAGFGDCGYFTETSLNKELNMIDVNIKAVHILTKLFLKDFERHNRGFILNVASMAAFAPGPLMATYYATKTYVLNLTKEINKELKKACRNVYVGCLCPGPVDTNFNNVAGVNFKIKGLDKDYVASYAIDQMLKKKEIIIPGFKTRCGAFFSKHLPEKMVSRYIFSIQNKKLGNTK